MCPRFGDRQRCPGAGLLEVGLSLFWYQQLLRGSLVHSAEQVGLGINWKIKATLGTIRLQIFRVGEVKYKSDVKQPKVGQTAVTAQSNTLSSEVPSFRVCPRPVRGKILPKSEIGALPYLVALESSPSNTVIIPVL